MRLPRSTLLIPALVFLLAQGALAGKAPKEDLTDFLAPDHSEGDYADWTNNNGTNWTYEIQNAVPWKKGRSCTWQTKRGGQPAGSGGRYWIPGKKLLTSGLYVGDFELSVPKPKKFCKLMQRLGQKNRVRLKGTAYRDGEFVGKFKRKGILVFEYFEGVETPAWKLEGAARFTLTVTTVIKNKETKQRTELLEESILWFVEDMGLVLERTRTQTTVDEALESDTGYVTSWFVSGIIGGVSYGVSDEPPEPPPPPPGGYGFTIQNGTAGYLSNVYIGSTFVGDMNPDQYYSVNYTSRPATVRVRAQGGGVLGPTVSWDYSHTVGTATSETSYIKLPPEYFSFWLTNASSSTITRVIVDWGLPTEVSTTLSMAPDSSTTYWFGFVGSHSNNNVRAESATGWWLYDPIEEPKNTNGVGSKFFSLVLVD